VTELVKRANPFDLAVVAQDVIQPFDPFVITHVAKLHVGGDGGGDIRDNTVVARTSG
jgi:hypothetical protein